MSTAKPFDPGKLTGLKRIKHLLPALASLREVGCQRDKANNRDLHFDEYVTLVLLYLANPMLKSVRALQATSQLDRVAVRLGVKQFSLGSFSESVRVFDPEKLKAVIHKLSGQLKSINPNPATFSGPGLSTHLDRALTMVDGSELMGVAKVAGAWLGADGYKLHAEFDFATGCPVDAQVTDARNSGKSDEKNVLRRHLKAGRCYILDRWHGQFKLLNDIRRAGSSYVVRMKENSVFDVIEERLLNDADLTAGVVRDAIVTMGATSAKPARPDHQIRLVVIEAVPHHNRGRHGGPHNKGTIVIATDLFDLPAHIIGLIYQHRWSIEIFFRFFKQILGCRHLISKRPQGVMIQVYCSIIYCMLINLWTGKKPTVRTVELLAFYQMDLLTEADVIAHLTRPDKTGTKLKAKAQLWKNLGW